MSDDARIIDTIAEEFRHQLAIHPWGRDLPYLFCEYVSRLKNEVAEHILAALRANGMNVIRREPITDTLRNRIAAALFNWDYPLSDGDAWETVDEFVREDFRAAADAVIRELNLRVAIVGDFQIALKGHYAREFPND